MSKSVTRRLSAGFITASPLNTSAHRGCEVKDLSLLRRHSSAPLRAFRFSVGPESSASRDTLRSIVVTPDTIPQFTIPKLAVEDRHPLSAKDRETQPGGDTAWKLTEDLTNPLHLSSSSVSSLPSSSPVLERKAQRSISDPADNRRRTSVSCIPCAFTESDQCSDPATRGALSLPHLAKITTPYGFVSLSQSPQMANEEELLLQKGYRSWARDQKNMPLRSLSMEKSGTMLAGQSLTNAESHHISRGINNSETSICSGSLPSPAKPKQRFWGVLHKHLSNQKLTNNGGQ